MDLNNFIEKFADAIDVETSVLTKETEFRELEEWDSIAYISVIAMLDEEYGIQIEMPQFKQLKTVGAIAEYIDNIK